MRKVFNSFKFALKGLGETLIFELNFRIMVFISLAVLAAMFYFPTSKTEKLILIITIFFVLILELINSAIERIMDFLRPEQDERVRVIKDLMAAIVLLVSLGALVVGLIIFWPYLKIKNPN